MLLELQNNVMLILLAILLPNSGPHQNFQKHSYEERELGVISTQGL